nr:cytochrome P450 [uncultured Chitinophaga sp.]
MPTAKMIHFDPDFPRMDGQKGAWQVYSYADVKNMLFDYQAYSNSYMPDNGMLGANINQLDPPLHTELRSLVTPYFGREAINAIEPLIVKICNRLFDDQPLNSFDFCNGVAYPLSAAVICHLLGVPFEDHHRIDNWAKDIVSAGYVPNGPTLAAIAQQEMAEFFAALLANNRLPADSLLYAMGTAYLEGQLLPPPIRIGTAMTILLAGYETTATLLSNCIYELCLNTDLQHTLRRSPDNIPQFILEVLRLRPSIVSMYRKVKRDINIQGEAIVTGSIINGWISTANRDNTVFQNPDRIELDRSNSNQALSFGYGIHHCVGAVLARTEARTMLTLLLSRSRLIDLQTGTGPQWSPSLITPSLLHLPITVQWS